MYCDKCGKQIPDQATFCPYCGTQIEQKPRPEKKKKKGGSVALICLSVILPVILLVGGGVMLLKNFQGHSEKTVMETTAETQEALPEERIPDKTVPETQEQTVPETEAQTVPETSEPTETEQPKEQPREQPKEIILGAPEEDRVPELGIPLPEGTMLQKLPWEFTSAAEAVAEKHRSCPYQGRELDTQAQGYLFDLDGDGSRELLLTYKTMTPEPEQKPALACDVYGLQNGQPQLLIEQFILAFPEEMASGRIQIAEKMNQYFLLLEHGEGASASDGLRKGSVEIYWIVGTSCKKISSMSYECRRKNGQVLYDMSKTVIDGKEYAYEEYEKLMESYHVLFNRQAPCYQELYDENFRFYLRDFTGYENIMAVSLPAKKGSLIQGDVEIKIGD